MDLIDHIRIMELPDEVAKKFFEALQKGDPRCRFKNQDRVVKTAWIDEKELHPIGAKGTVVGSLYLDDPASPDKEAYWIRWDGGLLITTTVGRRLERLLES